MAHSAVMSAVETAISAAWAGIASSIPIAGPNDGVTQLPADGTAVLFVEYPYSDEKQLTLGSPGSNFWREEGAFRCVLLVPTGYGTQPFSGYMDSLRAALRGKVYDSGALKTFEAPPASMMLQDDGMAFEIGFAVRYQYDLIG